MTAESGLSYRLDLRENGEENWRHTSEQRLQLRRLSACQCSPLALLLLILQNYGENWNQIQVGKKYNTETLEAVFQKAELETLLGSSLVDKRRRR